MSLKLILLQFDPAEARITARAFQQQGCFVAAICQNSRDLLSLVRQHRPDVLVMDAFFPGINCDEVAALLSQQYDGTLILLAISNCRNDLLAARFMDNGGHYFVVAPPDYGRCCARIKELLALYTRRLENRPDPIVDCVQKYQMLMGMSMKLVGVLYIQDAIKALIQHPDYLRRLSGALYPTVGAPYGANGTAVERGIRLAIDSVFEQGDLALLEQYFGAYIRKDSGKTSAGDFLFVLARMVSHDLGLKM